jgi:hypothetical protein
MMLPFIEQNALYDKIDGYLRSTNISHTLCNQYPTQPLIGVFRAHHNLFSRPISGGEMVIPALRCPSS